MSSYVEKFKDPRWQKKRLEIMERDDFTCTICGNSEKTLNVHHGYYERGKQPWDYPDIALKTLCEDCHEEWHQAKLLLDKIINFVGSCEEIDRVIGYTLAI